MSTGLNSMQLSHSATGNTNIREFVKDDLTVAPTVHTSSTTLTENVAGHTDIFLAYHTTILDPQV